MIHSEVRLAILILALAQFHVGQFNDVLEISLDVCAPVFASAPNHCRVDGTLHTVKDASQRTSREIILRIAWDHCSNVGYNVGIAAGILTAWLHFVHKIFDDFLIRLEIVSNDSFQTLRTVVIVFGFDRHAITWWRHRCQFTEHFFQLAKIQNRKLQYISAFRGGKSERTCANWFNSCPWTRSYSKSNVESNSESDRSPGASTRNPKSKNSTEIVVRFGRPSTEKGEKCCCNPRSN